MTSAAAAVPLSADGPSDAAAALVTRVLAPLRIPGGAATVRAILRETPAHDRVLSVAADGGASTLELAASSRTHAYGVEDDAAVVATARARASILGLRHAHVQHGDRARLPYPAAEFDLVLAGDLGTSLTDRQVLRECYRVARPFGAVALTPMYFRREPPRSLRNALATTVLGEPSPGGLDARCRAYASTGVDLIFAEEYDFDGLDVSRLNDYADEQVSAAGVAPAVAAEAIRRLQRELAVVGEALAYARHAVLLYRPRRPAARSPFASAPVPGTTRRP